MTLLDFPGHVACTVFLGGCDFRCPFCHNYELIDGTLKPQLTDDEFFSFLKKRKGLLDGVAITGGEPCLHNELIDFLERIREEGFAVKLDTNGNHPQLLSDIIKENLADYIAMDIKNSPEKYAVTTGLNELDISNIQNSISLLLSGKTDYEFRTTVVSELHEDKDFIHIGEWILGAERYFLQCFTDRDSVPFGNFTAPTKEQLGCYLELVRPYVKHASIRGID